MTESWAYSPWVTEHRDRIGFALQVFPIENRDDPESRHKPPYPKYVEGSAYSYNRNEDH